jgi:AraC-like DNA-binding protein/mannose-6-phosphate isomerase-like protein (cupin superfamily)
MSPHKRELLHYLTALPQEVFSLSRRLDARRYLARDFPKPLPLVISVQSYPSYRRMVGENWMHWHDYYELWVASGGGGEYCVGTQTFSFAPGDVVLVDPLKMHGVVRMEKTHAPMVVFFRTEAVAPGGAGVDLEFLSGWDRRPEKAEPRIGADTTAAAAVQGALLRLAQAWFAPASADGRQLALRFHLLDVLLQLRRAFDAPGGAPETMSMRAEREARLGRVLEFLAQRCHGHISQPEVARVAGMSTSRFRVFFKETTGWGFGDYLRDLRLERAARLLRESGDSVAEVAYRTGFSDQSHLQRLFKAKHSISPLAYRKQQQT